MPTVERKPGSEPIEWVTGPVSTGTGGNTEMNLPIDVRVEDAGARRELI
jgi:hypothetical protein